MSNTPKPSVGNGTPLEKALVVIAIGVLAIAPIWLDTHGKALLLMVPLAIALVDLLSGILHWVFDHHIQPANRLLGGIAVDFRDHHTRPNRTLEVGFYKSAFRGACFVALPLVGLALFVNGSPYLCALIYGFAAISLFAPQIHKLAHARVENRFLRFLQSSGLIMGKRAHARHHVPPQNRAFCIATGWCNPILDAVGFWRAMDFLVIRSKRMLGIPIV